MHRTHRARHRTTHAHHWLRRAFLTVGMAGALTGTFAVTTVSPASAVLCDPEVSIEIQMNTSNASGCADAGEVGSIEPSPIVQVLVEWVVTTPDGLILSGSKTEDVSGGSGSDLPVPIDLIDLSSLGDAAGKKCRAGDGWNVKSYYEARTRFYTAFKYHTDFTYIYDCKNVTNVITSRSTRRTSWVGRAGSSRAMRRRPPEYPLIPSRRSRSSVKVSSRSAYRVLSVNTAPTST